MEQEITLNELVALINCQEEEFIVHVNLGEEAVDNAKEESV